MKIVLLKIQFFYLSIQVRVLATDNGSPARSATAIVVVDIQRNFQPPTWLQTTYSSSVLETQALGIPFQQVSATDADAQVSWC